MPKAPAIIASSNPFHNLSAGQLADQLGALKADIADLETREKQLRDELVRRGLSEVEGNLFRATISEAVRWTIETAKVKEEMGEAWWNARCRQGLVTTVAVKARSGVTRLAA